MHLLTHLYNQSAPSCCYRYVVYTPPTMASIVSTLVSLPGMHDTFTKATPIQFIDSNKLISCRMGLTNHTQPTSHHNFIMPLVINGFRGGHTHTHTRTRTHTHTHTHTYIHTHTHILTCKQNHFKKPGTSGLWPHAPDLKYTV